VRARRGFTLLEMIAVLVVVGLLLAFSPLALDSLVAERELESEAGRLGTTIEILHTQAVLDQAPYAVHYDTEKHRYAIQTPVEVFQDNPKQGEEPVKVLVLEDKVEPSLLDWHQLPEGLSLELYEGTTRITAGSFKVTFDPRGTVDPHTLIMESNNVSSLAEEDRARTIKVNFPGFVSFAIGRVIDDFKKTESELGR